MALDERNDEFDGESRDRRNVRVKKLFDFMQSNTKNSVTISSNFGLEIDPSIYSYASA